MSTPDQAQNYLQLIEAIKLAREGDWQEVDRLLALYALRAPPSPVHVLGEVAGTMISDVHVNLPMRCAALVTRIEIEPSDLLVTRLSVGREIRTASQNHARTPATSVMQQMRLFPIRNGEWIELSAVRPEVPPMFPLTNAAPAVSLPTIRCCFRVWGCALDE